MRFGKLENVEIREYWQHEENEFTPWLARDANIQILADEIGVDLEVEDTEVYIGSFKADIVAKDAENRNVIIENQLSKTDHKHLGQLLTYASGLRAKLIIWVCKEVTDEHRQAIDWLNEITNADVSFFACEIELWKIGDSLPAPKFRIVSSPNDWSKTVKSTGDIDFLSPTKKLHLEFWNAFKEYMTNSETDLRMRTPRPQHWYSLAVGRSKFSINLTTNTQTKKVGCELYIRGKSAKQAYALLEGQKAEVEETLGPLNWQELPEGQDCRIIKYRDGDTRNRGTWPELHRWMKEEAEAFHKTFSPRVKSLNLSEVDVSDFNT